MNLDRVRSRRPRIAAAVLIGVSLVVSACGGDDESAGTTTHPQGHTATTSATASSSPAAIDRAFIAAMIPHHEGAIEMAEMALERGESDFVKSLAQEIIKAQKTEIDTLKRVDAEIADKAEPGDLGVPDHMMGMDQDMAKLRDAKDFDVTFIDMMVPHHEGAIEMAKVELEKGENTELKELARAIITAQEREIEEMSAFKQRENGAAAATSAPSGGTAESDAATAPGATAGDKGVAGAAYNASEVAPQIP